MLIDKNKYTNDNKFNLIKGVNLEIICTAQSILDFHLISILPCFLCNFVEISLDLLFEV